MVIHSKPYTHDLTENTDRRPVLIEKRCPMKSKTCGLITGRNYLWRNRGLALKIQREILFLCHRAHRVAERFPLKTV
jgi:hypothetical protein